LDIINSKRDIVLWVLGVSMQSATLISFDSKDITPILDELKIKTRKIEGKTYVVDDKDEIKSCEVCKRKLTPDKVGNIAYGSNLLFCNNPICFISYLEDKTKE